MKPKKALAKLARKKGDKKSERSILEHVKEAEKVVSEKVGNKIEKELVRIESRMTEWVEKGVELEAVQRFVGRIMKKTKELNIFVSCDHAVFTKEVGVVRLLEMDLVGTLNESGPVNFNKMQGRANELFHLAIDTAGAKRLERSWNGTAWCYEPPSRTIEDEGASEEEGTLQIAEEELVRDRYPHDPQAPPNQLQLLGKPETQRNENGNFYTELIR